MILFDVVSLANKYGYLCRQKKQQQEFRGATLMFSTNVAHEQTLNDSQLSVI